MKYNFEFNENDYKTPPELYQQALNRWNIEKFGMDTCCSDNHVPAEDYVVHGDRDGLSVEWKDFAWCNPPFNECRKWVQKACFENTMFNTRVAMLIPVRTETFYWHTYILNNHNVTIKWLRKGYKFLNKDNEEMGVFKNALALVYFE